MDMPVFYGAPSLLDRLMEEDDLDFNGFASQHFPPLQIFEDEMMLYVRACIPGVSLEDVSLTLKGAVLLIEGSVPSPGGRCLRQERACGPFVREVQLPCEVGGDAVEAVMRDGLLTVHLPKIAKKDGKRTILVENGKEAEHG
jgi:Molecular chaperone (small heat shock protein)